MPIKKKDFVEIEYTGRLKDEGLVFDTTKEKVAKDNKIHSEKAQYGAIVICVGEKQVVPGLDEGLVGKEIGEHKFEIKPENAFGKKNAKLIQLIPTKKFFEQQINPMPGLQVNIDGAIGVVRTVSGGRTLVDFNHPLSGKEVVYDVNVKRIVTDKKEQVSSLMNILGLKKVEVSVEGSQATIGMKAVLPAPITDELKKKIKELVGVDAEFVKIEEKKEEKKEAAGEKKEAGEKTEAETKEAKGKEATAAKGKKVGETNEKRAADAEKKPNTAHQSSL